MTAEYILIPFFAFIGALIAFFSGFGINTILVPAFAIFFPIQSAIALTSIIHFANNCFKLILLGKHANKKIVIAFGIPAMLVAFLGAYSLNLISNLNPLFIYNIGENIFSITILKLTISVLMIIFALYDLIPQLQKISFDQKFLPLGGMISGFLGGLSGHQGALRSAFLIKCNLSKEGFVGTSTVIAFLVDIARIAMYMALFTKDLINKNISLILLTVTTALIGVIIGNLLLKKITLTFIQMFVAIMVIGFGLLLGIGII